MKHILADIKQEVGYTVDRSQGHHRADTHRQTTIHTHDQYRVSYLLICMSLGCGRKLESQEKTPPTHTLEVLHTERPRWDWNWECFLLLGNNSNHHATEIYSGHCTNTQWCRSNCHETPSTTVQQLQGTLLVLQKFWGKGLDKIYIYMHNIYIYLMIMLAWKLELPKLLHFVLRVAWMCAARFPAIHPTLAEAFHSKPQLSTSRWHQRGSQGLTGATVCRSTNQQTMRYCAHVSLQWHWRKSQTDYQNCHDSSSRHRGYLHLP